MNEAIAIETLQKTPPKSRNLIRSTAVIPAVTDMDIPSAFPV